MTKRAIPYVEPTPPNHLPIHYVAVDAEGHVQAFGHVAADHWPPFTMAGHTLCRVTVEEHDACHGGHHRLVAGGLVRTPRPEPEGWRAEQVRAKRDGLLDASQWTMGRDSPLKGPKLEAWIAYRQALRDVPQQPGFPRTVEWPRKPA